MTVLSKRLDLPQLLEQPRSRPSCALYLEKHDYSISLRHHCSYVMSH